jgi:hypothetical protein
MAVGLIHAERKRALEPVSLQERDEIVVRRRETVDVATHVDVRVEEDCPLGEQPPQLVVVGRNESASTCERLVHAF